MVKDLYNSVRWIIFFFVLGIISNAYGHSVQVAYCANCNGDLRIWVEHWHSNEDINSTTMTIDVTVNGVTTTQTGSPNSGVLGVPFGSLTGCSSPLTIFGSCPNDANTYNDWVAYDFIGMPVGIPITITIISGNSAFTEDGCGMYPASTGVIIIPPPPTVSNTVGCSGTGELIGPFTFPQGNTWTNDNTAIGLAASGTGDIPAFLPAVSPTTQVANITLSNACGSSSFTITVKPSPVSNFTGPGVIGGTGIACPGQAITFTELSTPVSGSTIASWTWDFGDGSPPVSTQNPTHTFPLGQNSYTVTLTSTDANGCAPDTSIAVNINGPVAAFTTPNLCDSSLAAFTDATTPPSSISSWKWDFNNDGTTDNATQNPSFAFAGPGTYPVELLVEGGGCKDSITQAVVVHPKPNAVYTAAAQCLGQATSFNNASTVPSGTITGWSWDFNDGSALNTNQSPTYVYAAAGSYNVSLTVTSDSGCTDAVTLPVIVHDLPLSQFTFSNVCKYDSASFTNTSQNPNSGTIAAWSWNFGDGSPLNTTDWSAKHLYAAPGNYMVTLITQSSNMGCADTLRDTITVFSIPVANFGFSNVCFNQASTFNDLSTTSPGSITGWSWNFGDGSPLNTTASPSHTYTAPGQYAVTLIATSNNGCRDTVSKTTTVHALPVADYASTNVCFATSANFINSSTIMSTDTIQSWTWDFDDNTAAGNGQTVTHMYTSAGTYNVQLMVVSTFGCADSITKTLTVYPKPTADFSNTTVCGGNSTQFTDASTTPTGTISNWLWNFGDGSPANNTTSPSYIYTSAGIKTVTLIINNSFACPDTVTKPVTVHFNPIASFTYSNVCSGDTMYFNNTTTVDTSTSIASYLWSFGDSGPNSFVQHPAHYYLNPGNYTVTLVATTTDGCSSAGIMPVNAFDAPTSGMSFTNTCLSEPAVFTNTSVPPSSGTIASWSWNFGDGTPVNSSSSNPSHLYPSPGNYVITLITNSSNLGCSDTLKDTITVYNSPVADFSFTEVCEDNATTFTDLSGITGGDVITAWSWNFGDGSALSTQQNPLHIYTTSGAPGASLIVTTNLGCKDTIIKNVIVHATPVAQFSAPNTCLGNLTVLTDLSTIVTNPSNDVIQSRAWNYGDGSPVYNNQSPSHMYPATGTYTIQLVTVSTFGCADTITQTSTVSPKPVVNFTVDSLMGCEPLCVSFSESSTISTGSIASYLWNFGDGNPTDTMQNPGHCYINNLPVLPDYYDVTLTVTSDSGCVTILNKSDYVTVYPKPVADFTIQPQEATIVLPYVSITDASVGAFYWNWNFGDTATHFDTIVVSDSLVHTYADTGAYTITLITTSQYGCRDTASQNPYIAPDYTLYIPSGFTPNNDGKNDSFCAVGLYISKFEMTIYDRWGNFVFYTDDINKCWDGPVNNGSDVTLQDVYVYVVRVTDSRKRRHYYRDIVSVIR